VYTAPAALVKRAQ